MIRGILKYTVVGVAAGIIGYIGLTAYGEMTDSEAVQASESYELAQAQAENMSQALTSVGNFGTASQERPTNLMDDQSQPTGVQGAGPKSFADVDARQGTGTGSPELEPQPRPSAPPDIAEITDIDALYAEWQPRYDTARVAYVKLEASIDNAKSRAADYFARQHAITEQIRGPDNQARARQEDEWEIGLYRQWETKADKTLHTASQIGIQLDDMDAYLQKLRLRADFVFDPSQFQEVPQAIVVLNRQLVDFQTASENIRTATGSPFDAAR